MDEIRYIAENLGKTGMSIEKIANVLEMDIHIAITWAAMTRSKMLPKHEPKLKKNFSEIS